MDNLNITELNEEDIQRAVNNAQRSAEVAEGFITQRFNDGIDQTIDPKNVKVNNISRN